MTFHKQTAVSELTNSNKELLQIAEALLLCWAQEIKHGNWTNRASYETLLDEFAKADLNNNNIGLVRNCVSGYFNGRRKNVTGI